MGASSRPVRGAGGAPRPRAAPGPCAGACCASVVDIGPAAVQARAAPKAAANSEPDDPDSPYAHRAPPADVLRRAATASLYNASTKPAVDVGPDGVA